jgi:cell shape-determining protein MreD
VVVKLTLRPPLLLLLLLFLGVQTEKEITALLDLMVGFVRDGLLTSAEVVAGLQPSTSTIGDLA